MLKSLTLTNINFFLFLYKCKNKFYIILNNYILILTIVELSEMDDN